MSVPTRRSFLQQASLGALSLCLSREFSFGQAPAPLAQPAGPGIDPLPRATPESLGISPRGVLAFLDSLAEAGMEIHGFMLLRRGQVAAEGWWAPYAPALPHTLYSMSKSFTSTAVGFAVAEGLLSVEDKVVSHFPGQLPEKVSDHLAALRVKDLLTMAVGHDKDPTWAVVKEQDWVKAFLAWDIPLEPGSRFLYNSAATYMGSALVRKLTGQRMLDYLTPRLFQPLGITGMRWETCPLGNDTGGWGLSLPTEGLARFGQFLLQKGEWRGKQILPAAWIDEATRAHVQQPGGDKEGRPKAKNDWLQGYGYQFWRSQHGAFRGDGAFGQFTVVMPEQEAVLVLNSESRDMQGMLDRAWEHLLPAFGPAPAESAADSQRLATRLGGLRLDPPKGGEAPPLAAEISGKAFSLEKNALGLASVGWAFEAGQCVFIATEGGGNAVHRIVCGLGEWRFGETALPGTPPRLISGGKPPEGTLAKVAASAAWTSPDTLVMTWRFHETPHHDTVTCRFEGGGGGVSVAFLNSITAMNPQGKDAREPLVGTRPA